MSVAVDDVGKPHVNTGMLFCAFGVTSAAGCHSQLTCSMGLGFLDWFRVFALYDSLASVAAEQIALCSFECAEYHPRTFFLVLFSFAFVQKFALLLFFGSRCSRFRRLCCTSLNGMQLLVLNKEFETDFFHQAVVKCRLISMRKIRANVY